MDSKEVNQDMAKDTPEKRPHESVVKNFWAGFSLGVFVGVVATPSRSTPLLGYVENGACLGLIGGVVAALLGRSFWRFVLWVARLLP